MHNTTYRSLNMVDPELRDFLKAWPISDISVSKLDELRRTLTEISSEKCPVNNDNIERKIVEIPSIIESHSIRSIVNSSLSDTQDLKNGYFQIHGGGFIMGFPELTESRNQSIAQELDCVVFSPSYRLAPEVKYPGAIEDCYASLKHFYQNSEQYGINPNNIIIGGESAGGGLAASLSILARDRGEIPICGQVLVYPMLDDRTGTTTYPESHMGEFIWTSENNRLGWTSILDCPPGSEGVSPYAAAAREKDLTGLPPTQMFVGALDLFLDENLLYAQRLIASRVPLGLTIYDGAYHGFDMFESSFLGNKFRRDYFDAISRLWKVK